MALMNVVFDQLIGSFNGDTGTQATLNLSQCLESFFDNSDDQLTARPTKQHQVPHGAIRTEPDSGHHRRLHAHRRLINSLLHLRLEARARDLVHDRPTQHLRFNAMNETVFRESSKFGIESISAFRTVTAPVMAENIRSRYNSLLNTTSCHISVWGDWALC
ncbi:hypothetical protein QR685DRAFT_567495 [Neurospora intermedia]|uniref:Uncharacterized protein n=1 Tax=Neurospora intermedia TaxID=5142 RepID=A0ABR3DPI4_NEUIN